MCNLKMKSNEINLTNTDLPIIKVSNYFKISFVFPIRYRF